MGRSDIEDALKRLHWLTQEEARMAAAQVLKVANIIDDRVQGIEDKMISVDIRVAGVDDGVAGIDDRIKDVHFQVKGVDDGVKGVDDKVAAVIDGAQHVFYQSLKNRYSIRYLDGKVARVVIQQAADDVDQVKRL